MGVNEKQKQSTQLFLFFWTKTLRIQLNIYIRFICVSLVVLLGSVVVVAVYCFCFSPMPTQRWTILLLVNCCNNIIVISHLLQIDTHRWNTRQVKMLKNICRCGYSLYHVPRHAAWNVRDEEKQNHNTIFTRFEWTLGIASCWRVSNQIQWSVVYTVFIHIQPRKHVSDRKMLIFPVWLSIVYFIIYCKC